MDMPVYDRLKFLAHDLREIGAKMEFYGGFATMGQRGRDLITAAEHVDQWADEWNGKLPQKITPGINPGDYFTVQGTGKSARGHDVVLGRSVKTGRKMKVVQLKTWRAKCYE